MSRMHFGMASSGMEMLYTAGEAMASLMNRDAREWSVIGTPTTCHPDVSMSFPIVVMSMHLWAASLEPRAVTRYLSNHTSVWTPGLNRENAVTRATSGSLSEPSYVASRIDMVGVAKKCINRLMCVMKAS